MAGMASPVDEVAHKFLAANDIKLHYVEMGSGPTVLFLHGFPDCWYGFRYQIPALATAGFHVVVPDLRGFGESSAPESADQYFVPLIVGDIIALLDSLQVKQALVIGHDWGVEYAADLCLMRPDRVKALVFLGPYMPNLPSAQLKAGQEGLSDEIYTKVFQKPGQAEALFASTKTANVIKAFFLRWHLVSPLLEVPRFYTDEDDEPLPQWFTEKDVEYYSETFDKSGFTGGFNHYRAWERNTELKSPWTLASIQTPCMAVLARKDLFFILPGLEELTHPDMMKKFLPNLQKHVILEDGTHFFHQQMHGVVNNLLLDFLRQYSE